MAMTVQAGFEQLKQNLQISDLQEETVSIRQQNIREVLQKGMKVLDSFLIGSYKRSTMIAPLTEADIDIFIILDPNYYEQTGQASLLDKVKQVLKQTYPRTPEISRNGQAVTISFSDFKVDVVPGFYRESGGFIIPDSILKRWISTDPKKHIEIWNNANRTHKENLIPLIKMIKGWNKSHGLVLRSFHLETLILQILNNVEISDFSSGTRYVFDKGRTLIACQITDPAGYGGDIGVYLDTIGKIAEVVSQLEKAYKFAIEAERLVSNNDVRQAFDKWKLIFGDYFPSYG